MNITLLKEKIAVSPDFTIEECNFLLNLINTFDGLHDTLTQMSERLDRIEALRTAKQ